MLQPFHRYLLLLRRIEEELKELACVIWQRDHEILVSSQYSNPDTAQPIPWLHFMFALTRWLIGIVRRGNSKPVERLFLRAVSPSLSLTVNPLQHVLFDFIFSLRP
jgi:hypothetical protein